MTLPTPDRDRIFADLSALVSFNSPHSVPALADSHEAACAWTVTAFEQLGFSVERYPTIDNADTIIANRAGEEGCLLYTSPSPRD